MRYRKTGEHNLQMDLAQIFESELDLQFVFEAFQEAFFDRADAEEEDGYTHEEIETWADGRGYAVIAAKRFQTLNEEEIEQLLRDKSSKSTNGNFNEIFSEVLTAKGPMEPALISGFCGVKRMRVFECPWTGN